jgi:hypothetical protein
MDVKDVHEIVNHEETRSHSSDAKVDDVRDDASSIRSEALGDSLPKGYFYSIQFIGALIVSSTENWKVSCH